MCKKSCLDQYKNTQQKYPGTGKSVCLIHTFLKVLVLVVSDGHWHLSSPSMGHRTSCFVKREFDVPACYSHTAPRFCYFCLIFIFNSFSCNLWNPVSTHSRKKTDQRSCVFIQPCRFFCVSFSARFLLILTLHIFSTACFTRTCLSFRQF